MPSLILFDIIAPMTNRNGHGLTIDALIERAGGAHEIARRSKKYTRSIGAKAVYKWSSNGCIPQWHWPLLKDLAGVSEIELYAVNQQARASKHRGRQVRAA